MASTNHMVVELDVLPLLSNSLHNDRLVKTNAEYEFITQANLCCMTMYEWLTSPVTWCTNTCPIMQ